MSNIKYLVDKLNREQHWSEEVADVLKLFESIDNCSVRKLASKLGWTKSEVHRCLLLAKRLDTPKVKECKSKHEALRYLKDYDFNH